MGTIKQRQPLELWYTQPAQNWEEALPIGNGRIGGMVYGEVKEETILLNEDTLWSGFPRDTINYEALRYLKPVREHIFNNDFKKAEKLIEANMVGRGTESYQPMGSFHLHLNGHENPMDYRRSLDLDTAITEISYRIGDTGFRREVFISPVDQVLVVNLTSNGDSLLNLLVSLDSIQKHEFVTNGMDILLNGTCPSHVASNFFGDHSKSIQYEDSLGISFSTRLRTVITEGCLTRKEGNKIQIKDARQVTFFLAAESNFVNYHQQPETPHSDLESRCERILNAACELTYEKIKQRHIIEHQRLFKRVNLNLGNGTNSQYPTDQRLNAYKEGAQDTELEALYFQYGRYLLISSSRTGTQPANLQGIWNPYIQPPWNSDYTTNINTEMNYWLAESCNLSECHEPLFDLIEDLSVIGQRTARLHYDARGWAAHHNVDIWRMTTPTDGEASWAFWPMGGVWLTRHLWEHYLYTQDHEFLEKKAYPIMKGASLFCLDWLVKGPNGDLITAPSTSPENKFITKDGEVCSTSFGSTMDLSLIRELFVQCIEASTRLQIDHQFKQELKETIEQLAPFKIGKWGQLQEWYEDFEENELGHRHFSHLYSLFPGNQINLEDTPELAKASRISLERRLENGSGHTGWSCAWVINLSARLLDSQRAYKGLRTLLSRSTHPNLLDDHPPFQIDGNFGGSAGLAEMLLQSHLGRIILLPALPDEWSTGFVRGLKAQGNFIVDIEWENHQLKKALIKSLSGAVCRISYKQEELNIFQGNQRGETHNQKFVTEPGLTYTIMLKRNEVY